MTSLIQSIISKPNWEQKINDPEIINKWKQETNNDNLIDVVINLLNNYKKSYKNKYDYYNINYYSHTGLKINVKIYNIFKNTCNCKCIICTGYEFIKNEELDNDELQEYKSYYDENAICKCDQISYLHKYEFLNEYTYVMDNLINNNILDSLNENVKLLPRNDFHPGSNNKIIDLVHPSLNCYVDGITEYNNIDLKPKNVFQWLPSNFKVNDDNSTEILSDINNLDRNIHKLLYNDISNIFSLFVPSFNNLINKLKINKIYENNNFDRLKDCQVIVKLSDTELKPEDPYFEGGHWHLEGLPDEHIIATSIYYYEMDNITENYLNFRVSIDEPETIYYPQNCIKYVNNHYGFNNIKDSLSNEKAPTVELGKIETLKGRSIVFPNFLQHKLSEFKTIISDKMGSRKILVFFLIDPNKRILSTQEIISNNLSIEDANIYRELLMFQRKYNIDEQNKYYQREWSLCEH